MISTALLLLLAAWLIAKFGIPVTYLGAIAAGCALVGSGITGLFAGRLHGRKGLIIGLFCGGIWLLALLVGNLLLYGLQMDALFLVKLIGCFVLSVCGAFFGALSAQQKKKRSYRYG
jgi:putative membrane protein (TIGR04086 family)